MKVQPEKDALRAALEGVPLSLHVS